MKTVDYKLADILKIPCSRKKRNTPCQGHNDFLSQRLDFLINAEYSVLQPCDKTEFYGIIVYLKQIIFLLPEDKVNFLIKQCHVFTTKHELSVIDMAQLIGKFASKKIPFFSATLYYRSLQKQQILESTNQKNLEGKPGKFALVGEQLKSPNGKALIVFQPHVFIASHASSKGLGTVFQG